MFLDCRFEVIKGLYNFKSAFSDRIQVKILKSAVNVVSRTEKGIQCVFRKAPKSARAILLYKVGSEADVNN